MRLEGKNVLVTGALGGIGSATVRLMAEEGANLVLTDLQKQGSSEFIASLPGAGRKLFISADLCLERSVVELYEQVKESLGDINVVANIAGYDFENSVPVEKISSRGLTACLDTNLISCSLSCREAIKLMADSGGRIVNVCSMSYKGSPRQIAYSSAKGGVYQLTRHLAKQYAGKGIGINGIAPGFTEVQSIKKTLKPGMWPILKFGLTMANPLGRIGQPEDMAKGIVFLASEDSSFMQGQILEVNGGL